jgi:RNA-directed DNA polymerase
MKELHIRAAIYYFGSPALLQLQSCKKGDEMDDIVDVNAEYEINYVNAMDDTDEVVEMDDTDQVVFRRKEIPSLLWLAKGIKIDDKVLGNILVGLRNGEFQYSEVLIPKSGGGTRVLSIPHPLLRYVQKKINKYFLSDFLVHPCAFGFSGGSIVDAITPHLGSKVMLSFDIVNAFDQISKENLLRSLTGHRITSFTGGKTRTYYEHLSWYVSNMMAEICTWNNRLPQGAPTSPRLFDYVFNRADALLSRLGGKVGGVYTRYADNIFFSFRDKTFFPPKLERAILRVLCREKYNWHKRSIRRMGTGSIRMLGLNVMEGKISVPRDYKRRLRLAQHHIRYLLEHNLPFEEPWSRLKGQMNFGSLGILPDSLVETYTALEREIEGE